MPETDTAQAVRRVNNDGGEKPTRARSAWISTCDGLEHSHDTLTIWNETIKIREGARNQSNVQSNKHKPQWAIVIFVDSST